MRVKNFNINVGSQVFKACAEEPRLRVLHLVLNHGEMCISDLEQILGYTQTKTSRHVTYLKNSGLLNIRKNEKWVWYSVKDEMKDILFLIFDFLKKDQMLKSDSETFQTLLNNRALAYNKQKAEEWKLRR